MIGHGNIILAAGGTGGHMMPAEAVADTLINKGYDVTLITDSRGNSIGNVMSDLDRIVLKATSHMAGGVLGKIRSFFNIFRSTLQARSAFRVKPPTVVVGFGGYPSLPAILAARSLGIRYVLHEQNAVLGRVNRFMAKKAAVLALSVAKTKRIPQGVKTNVTGNPVRLLITKVANIAYAVPMGWGDIRVFVLGGSQGARILSDVVPAAIAALPPECRDRLDMVHQARPEDVERVRGIYQQAGVKVEVKSYFDDVSAVLLRTQLVIARSGASTLSELTAMGRPAIMVPLAIAADGHQLENARIVEEAGGGFVMQEHEFTPQTLTMKLEKLFKDMGELRDWSDGMRTIAQLDAAENLSQAIIEVCTDKGENS